MISKLSEQELLAKLEKDFGGTLDGGGHKYGQGACCALELVCAVRECAPQELSDSPEKTGMPDIRPLNDAPWASREKRTKHMLPLIAAYSDWREWSLNRKVEVMSRIAIRNVSEVLPLILRAAKLDEQAKKCEETKDLSSAASAAKYAAEYAASAASAASAAEYAASAKYAAAYAKYAAAYAKYAAASAASAAAYAAASAAEYAASAKYAALRDQILALTCRIWVEEAKATEV